MLTYPAIDPVAIQLGPVAVHWYGLMYVIAIGACWGLGLVRARREDSGWSADQVGDLVFYAALGGVLGGRIGSILFYDLATYLDEPLRMLMIWKGGMSFHGGMLGVFTAIWFYGRSSGRGFFGVSDFFAPLVPIGICAGRIGNFINGELWGKPTDVAWGMIFPHVDGLVRHPSQLYQAALEGLVLFAILWFYSSKPRPRLAVSGMFMLWYGVFRFAVEFVRVPDADIGYDAFDWLTRGQILTVPMIGYGIWLLVMSRRRYGRVGNE